MDGIRIERAAQDDKQDNGGALLLEGFEHQDRGGCRLGTLGASARR